MNRTHSRYVVLAALLAFVGAGLYSEAARCCDADGVGTAKAVATPLPATVTPAAPQVVAPAARPEVATVQPVVTAGSAAPSDDAGNNLGDGSPVGAHKRGLRWQSFLPGVIK
ncbi:MAG: hypothetical protein JSS16_12795 [Proteobacteria bacterium]|uniref:hypothetical protein n=1 Tax=Rudaea sp. TaxID=2136325 RepID=UPI001DF38068|nr:hypothetical protein [Pseudomonadota bacterium]MBS0567111.1 hypothetical protein [Pseudomonadota bacterium]